MIQKHEIRKQINDKRHHISKAEQLSISQQISKRIQSLRPYRESNYIALYYAIDNEIDLSLLWDSDIGKKTFYFPVIAKNELIFLPATRNTVFHKNKFGILEPDVNIHLACAQEQLDIAFVPLVAFDTHGTRIGMGGGYYDRTFAFKRPRYIIGVAYEFQKQAFIQPDSWDVPMSLIITDCATYWSNKP